MPFAGERLGLAVEVGLEPERVGRGAGAQVVVGRGVTDPGAQAARRAQPHEGEVVGHGQGRARRADRRLDEGRPLAIQVQREDRPRLSEQRRHRRAEDPFHQPVGRTGVLRSGSALNAEGREAYRAFMAAPWPAAPPAADTAAQLVPRRGDDRLVERQVYVQSEKPALAPAAVAQELKAGLAGVADHDARRPGEVVERAR